MEKKSYKVKYLEIFLIMSLISLFVGKYFLEHSLEEKKPHLPLRKMISSLSEENPEEATVLVTALSLGFKEVVADFLFLQSIQYFGDWELGEEAKFKKIYPVIQAMVSIAPHFVPGYSFGALALDEIGHVNEAIEILNKGIKNNPRAFELWLYRDFTIRLFKTHEYKKAIEGIKLALKQEGYPPILERILAYAYEKDGQTDKALMQWKKILKSTRDLKIKEICQRHIKRLTEGEN